VFGITRKKVKRSNRADCFLYVCLYHHHTCVTYIDLYPGYYESSDEENRKGDSTYGGENFTERTERSIHDIRLIYLTLSLNFSVSSFFIHQNEEVLDDHMKEVSYKVRKSKGMRKFAFEFDSIRPKLHSTQFSSTQIITKKCFYIFEHRLLLAIGFFL
jgi:hypothetical protein